MKVCDFCNKPVQPEMYIEVENGIKCFDCCTKEAHEFISNMCNCGICTLLVPCDELTYYSALDADICENCFNLLNEEDERNNR